MTSLPTSISSRQYRAKLAVSTDNLEGSLEVWADGIDAEFISFPARSSFLLLLEEGAADCGIIGIKSKAVILCTRSLFSKQSL
eukprot:CAMPEP_0179456026 /NCGR_PEP_ID=MMETSP0799-20121207/39849_1 /TAXON_ID=46947 /ORGANISM="Geminigera cryophila, Strain CCMP2564" /LENGTH=82 /DNA_ID=CAMNT_0021255411 /DNA_START=145 /DNA_END=393 /DNA_ORIENTATION=-